MKTISFDIDGVLARFDEAFVNVVNDLFDKHLPLDYQPNDWEYSEVLTPEEMTTAFNRIKKQKNFWRNLKSYDRNIDSLSKFLHEECKDYVVYYITSRMDTQGESAFGQTAHWLIEHDLYFYNTSLLVVRDPKEKNNLLRSLNVKASLDDYLPTVVQANGIPDHQAFLLDRPWNRKNRYDVWDPSEFNVVSTVQEYINELRVLCL